MRQLNLTITAGLSDLWVQAYDDNKRQVPITAVLLDRWVLQIDNGDPSSGALNVRLRASGYQEWDGRMMMPPDNTAAEAGTSIQLEPSAIPFPPGIKRPQLAPPFDAPDYNPDGSIKNAVHTVPPPELLVPPVIPPTRDTFFIRANFWGVTTPEPQLMLANGSPDIAGLQAIGANTNYNGAMWTTFLLELLPVARQNYFLDFYTQQRPYTHIGYTRPRNMGNFLDLCSRSHARSLQVMYADVDLPSITALAQAKAIDQVIIGFEVNKTMSPEAVMALIPQVAAICRANGMPDPWIEFTSNYRSYPPNQGISEVAWAQQVRPYLTGLFWESGQSANSEDSAGLMGAELWEARWFWAQIDPTFKICAGEIMSMRNFYGQCTENRSDLRALEMLFCTRGAPAPNAPPVSGSASGPGRWANGSPL